VDCSYAKVERRIDGRLVSPMAWIGQLFAEWSLPMQPVIHLEDSPDDLADAGRVPLGQGQGARGKGTVPFCGYPCLRSGRPGGPYRT
jgi:hypothetical protein